MSNLKNVKEKQRFPYIIDRKPNTTLGARSFYKRFNSDAHKVLGVDVKVVQMSTVVNASVVVVVVVVSIAYEISKIQVFRYKKINSNEIVTFQVHLINKFRGKKPQGGTCEFNRFKKGHSCLILSYKVGRYLQLCLSGQLLLVLDTVQIMSK